NEYAALSPSEAGALVRRRMVLDARNVLDAEAWRNAGWTVRALGAGSGVLEERTPEARSVEKRAARA
ncbi:hypothetical protein, partial [Paraburkholderia sp. SIMBA_027]